MQNFITEDFLLETETAKVLYHEYAEDMPIYDYHCHLPPEQIVKDIKFKTLTEVWLYGDHYKWRAMRINGVEERYCTGDASDKDKFKKWAETVPYCMRNPLYHWTHLELKRYFGVDELLNRNSAKRIYESCNEKLQSEDYSVRNLLRKMNVRLVCTTEDPLDPLEYHRLIAEDEFEIKVYTAWRPDKAMMTEDLESLNDWIDKLAELTNIDIGSFDNYIEAIEKRHSFFHRMGCRLSDHGIETAYAEDYSKKEIEDIFDRIRAKKELSKIEHSKFKSAMMHEFGIMDHEKGWVQQLHLGALRNNSTRLYNKLGPDTGFDSIGDFDIARPLSGYLDRLDVENKLAKTIIYNLNPSDNELIATMTGNFQDGSVPGKMQHGAAWWFSDQKDGIERHLESLSNLGLLRRFVGMLTDSRSFLSFPRHEYFRRILCNMLGSDVENGLLPGDMEHIGSMIKDICFNNAVEYFDMKLD